MDATHVRVTSEAQMKILSLVLALAMSTSLYADENLGPLKALMHSFVLELQEMSPYLSDKAKFESAEGKKAN